MGHSYMVYQLADLVPPLVVGGVTVLLGFLSAMFVIIFMLCKLSQGKNVRIPCLFGMYAAISVVFRDAIKKKSTKTGPVFVLWDRKVSPMFIPALFIILPGLFACFITSFWGVFLIENSYTCDPALDCFPIDAEQGNLQNDPIVNCSDFNTNDNITILCYQFVFRFAAGTAFLGGLLAFTATLIKLLGSLLVWSLNLDGKEMKVEEEDKIGCCSVCCHHCYSCLKSIVLATLIFSPSILTIVTLIAVIAVPFVREALTDRQRTLQFWAYYVTLFYIGGLVPGFILTLRRSKPYEKPIQTVNSKAQNDSLEEDNGTHGQHSGTRLLSVEKRSSYASLN